MSDVLSAYFAAEDAVATRRTVWKAVAVAGLVLWSLGVFTSALTTVDLAFVVPLLGLAVAASGATEWRTRRHLQLLLQIRRDTR